MIEEIIVEPLMSNDEISQYEGTYFNRDHYNIILDHDADVYVNKDGVKQLLLKFRKNVIDKQLTDAALHSYRALSKTKNTNRGASAGLLDIERLPEYMKRYKLENTQRFSTGYIKLDGEPSKTTRGNVAHSSIAGYYDNSIATRKNKMPPGGPCRTTMFTSKYVKRWEDSLPFLIRCDAIFKELVPDKWHKQWSRATAVPEFNIANTAFSTITLNYSWRTAMHRDRGDYIEGFGNLIVIEDFENPNTYEGCYTGFPQYGVAVDCRSGDFLAMDVHEWHCNTEFISAASDNFNRLSVVCYLRNNMIKCKRAIPPIVE
jgi:hypothetical protein